jgi:hypothetical protein
MVQGRVADQGVTVLDFLDDRGGKGSPTSHIRQEFRNVLNPFGTTVGEQKDRGAFRIAYCFRWN